MTIRYSVSVSSSDLDLLFPLFYLPYLDKGSKEWFYSMGSRDCAVLFLHGELMTLFMKLVSMIYGENCSVESIHLHGPITPAHHTDLNPIHED